MINGSFPILEQLKDNKCTYFCEKNCVSSGVSTENPETVMDLSSHFPSVKQLILFCHNPRYMSQVVKQPYVKVL